MPDRPAAVGYVCATVALAQTESECRHRGPDGGIWGDRPGQWPEGSMLVVWRSGRSVRRWVWDHRSPWTLDRGPCWEAGPVTSDRHIVVQICSDATGVYAKGTIETPGRPHPATFLTIEPT